jgi:Sec-independent protein translocase protein TatA
MPSTLILKLIAGAAALAMLVVLILDRNHWKATAADRKASLELICVDVRDASGNQKLDCRDVPLQIKLLGDGVRDLKTALASQNQAVDALGEQSRAQQAESAKAAQGAEKRAAEAEGVSDALKASSRAGGAQAANCAPSKALTEAWR